MLKRRGLRRVMPRIGHPNKTSIEETDAYKKITQAVRQMVNFTALDNNKHFCFMYQDEAEFGRINKPKACWRGNGIRSVVPYLRVR